MLDIGIMQPVGYGACGGEGKALVDQTASTPCNWVPGNYDHVFEG